MSSYAELLAEDMYLGASRNGPDEGILSLFQKSDLVIDQMSRSDYHPVWRVPDEAETTPIEVVRYSCPIGHAVDRLELMGFTMEVARRGFERGRQYHLELIQSFSSPDPEFGAKQRRVMESLTVDRWLQELDLIRLSRLRPRRPSDPICEGLPELLHFMLCESGHDWYGFHGFDHRHFIRLALSLFDPDQALTYDLTDLVEGGYVDETGELLEYTENILDSSIGPSPRIIVLTEGATDSRILRRALRWIYPHLVEYFHFLDFEASNVGGGAGNLANTIKAFAGAGIVNQTIALFDNDAAAHDALRSVRAGSLPRNLATITYPPLESLRSYPTMGPTGPARLDVNGLAGSIELYLGERALQGDDGEPIPIQWKGYIASVDRYHGELVDKRLPVERFERLTKALEEGKTDVGEWD